MVTTTMKAMAKRALGWIAAAGGIAAAFPAAASTITYYHNDIAGSPVAATNSARQVIWRESYRPYGERLTKSASAKSNDVWFTSRREDSSGLVYMGARHYDPVAARFVSTDPKGFDEANVLSFGRYTYANDNPYKYRDPDGKYATVLVRAEYSLVFAVATQLGARALGAAIGIGLYEWMHNEQAADPGKGENGDGAGEAVRDVVVPSDKYPEAAEHIRDAQGDGQPEVLTVDRGGARGRRADALSGHDVVPGKDRDEYPPSMFGEGGRGASVRPISPSDNRGAGACIGAQCRDLPDGSRVRIVPK